MVLVISLSEWSIISVRKTYSFIECKHGYNQTKTVKPDAHGDVLK